MLLSASVTGMSIGNLQKILLHDIHNLLCNLILKHESTSPEFIWGFQCSLLGSKIHYLGQEKSNSLHGSTQVVNIHYLGQIHNLGQNIYIMLISMLVDFHHFFVLYFKIFNSLFSICKLFASFFSLPIHPWEALKNWSIQSKPVGLLTKCSIEVLVRQKAMKTVIR